MTIKNNVLAGISMPDDMTGGDRLFKFQRKYRITNVLVRNCLCEFVATTFLIYTGSCVNAQTVLSRFQMNQSLGLNIGWGLCLIFAAQMGYRISGAHLNPAVSFFSNNGCICWLLSDFYSLLRENHRFRWRHTLYCRPNATAGIFATYPGNHLSVTGSMIDQVSSTTILCIIVGVITDERNKFPNGRIHH
uniref:Uncharacterized protein n=1 Tax=Ditylenchus dipsaci TaxID=166011 RepID=A0A915D1B1_9BILA